MNAASGDSSTDMAAIAPASIGSGGGEGATASRLSERSTQNWPPRLAATVP